MTVDEARIILLEDELIQAHHTIDFLDKCARQVGNYKYGYPEQTARHLEDIRALVEIPEGCHHSRHHSECASCVDRARRHELIAVAKELIQPAGEAVKEATEQTP
jgi:hypothetical protein